MFNFIIDNIVNQLSCPTKNLELIILSLKDTFIINFIFFFYVSIVYFLRDIINMIINLSYSTYSISHHLTSIDLTIYLNITSKQLQKQVMQQLKNKITQNYVAFQTIGKSDHHFHVPCKAIRHQYVQYGLKNQVEPLDQKNNHETANIKTNAFIESNRCVKKEKKDGIKADEEEKCYYWPCDIIGDGTGGALKQLRSYIQSHKINSYIRLMMPKYSETALKTSQVKENKYIQNPQITIEEKQNEINKIEKTKNFIDQNKMKNKRIQEERLKKENNKGLMRKKQVKNNIEIQQYQNEVEIENNICLMNKLQENVGQSRKSKGSMKNRENKNRIIKIDYQIVDVKQSGKKRSSSNPIVSSYLSNISEITQLKPGYNIIQIKSERQETENKQKSRIEIERRQKLTITPNTSTGFHTIRSEGVNESVGTSSNSCRCKEQQDNWKNKSRKRIYFAEDQVKGRGREGSL